MSRKQISILMLFYAISSDSAIRAVEAVLYIKVATEKVFTATEFSVYFHVVQ